MWPFRKKQRQEETPRNVVSEIREAAQRYELSRQEIEAQSNLSEEDKTYAINHARSRYLKDIAAAFSK